MSVKNSLVSKLQTIIDRGKPITQKTLAGFLDTLERNHPKYINDKAYNLIKEDVYWLLSN